MMKLESRICCQYPIAYFTTAAGSTALTPVDEAALCLGFSAFRGQLLRIINRKDARALLRVVDRNVHLSFGDASGHEDFGRMWLSERSVGDPLV